MEGAGIAAKVRLRLVLPTILLLLLSSLDRVNISFAALQMNRELGLTPSQYGFGAGILFVGFLAGQYPSIFLLQRFGMRRWITGCTVGWGSCATAMAFIANHQQLYVLRILLGLFESGLAPGIVIYLAQFATERERATTFALPMVAIPVSVVVGGPISGWLMSMAPAALSGWRWMFLGEGIPTILLGIAAYLYFPDTPTTAHWLAPHERRWLVDNASNRPARAGRNDWRVLSRPAIWASAALWFCLLSGSYGIIFWLPQMVQQLTGLPPLAIAVINALPWIGAAIGMWCNAFHSDRYGERFWHIALPALVAATGIVAAAGLGAGVAGLAALLVVGIGLGAAQGAFWALPTALFTPRTFAVGAVTINIAGSAGGLVMPHLIGLTREAGMGVIGPTLLLAGVLTAGAGIVLALRMSSLNDRATMAWSPKAL